jgi:hypothetical protein
LLPIHTKNKVKEKITMSIWDKIADGFKGAANTVAGGATSAANKFVGGVESGGVATWKATSAEARVLGENMERAGMKVSDAFIAGVEAVKSGGVEKVVEGANALKEFAERNACDIFIGSSLSAAFATLAATGEEQVACGSLSLLVARRADNVLLKGAAKILAVLIAEPVYLIPGVSSSGLDKAHFEMAVSFIIVKACEQSPKQVVGTAGQFLAGAMIYGITKLVCEGTVPGGFQVWKGANASMWGTTPTGNGQAASTGNGQQAVISNAGWRGPNAFNVKFYLATYPDLQSAFGIHPTLQSAFLGNNSTQQPLDPSFMNNLRGFANGLDHWIIYGVKEGRRGSLEFDAQFYLNTYPDLKAAFGRDFAAALDHWLTYGLKEGRRGSFNFDAQFYLNTYPDLKAAFGKDFAAALDHWITYGLKEGRRATKEFDAQFYLATYPDLKAAFGTNYAAALEHWITYGLKEGRRATKEFDAQFYLATYPDLKAAFGKDYVAALDHWLTYGLKEGRKGAPSN